MITQHTPNPWASFVMAAADKGVIAQPAGNNGYVQYWLQKAIVANLADELLTTLEMVDAEWTKDIPEGPDFNGDPTRGYIHPDHVRIWKSVRAAIAKAKGGAA